MTTLFTKYTSNKTEDSEQELLTHIIRSFRKTRLKFAKPNRRFLARLVQDWSQQVRPIANSSSALSTSDSGSTSVEWRCMTGQQTNEVRVMLVCMQSRRLGLMFYIPLDTKRSFLRRSCRWRTQDFTLRRINLTCPVGNLSHLLSCPFEVQRMTILGV